MSEHESSLDRQLSGDVLAFDLKAEGASLLETARQAAVGRAAETIVKDGPLRLTLLALKAGAVVNEHQAPGPVVIRVVSGEAEITGNDQAHRLTEANVLVFGAGVRHKVEAVSDALILVTIAMPV